jgi:superfamily II DNA helicase RecQ
VSFDGTVPVQKLLSTVYRVDQRFAAGHVIDVLRGQETDRIKTWHHDSLSVFGIGADRSEQEWRAILRQVIALGLLTVDHEQFSSLKLTDAARPVLKGGQKVQLRQYQKPVAETEPRCQRLRRKRPVGARAERSSTACARGAWARRASTTSPPTSSSTTPPCAKSPRPARPRWTTCAASPASARKLPPTATKSSA